MGTDEGFMQTNFRDAGKRNHYLFRTRGQKRRFSDDPDRTN